VSDGIEQFLEKIIEDAIPKIHFVEICNELGIRDLEELQEC
jgi:hypothetical protein